MKLFKAAAQKNILILGNEGCGKRSFILQYKEGFIRDSSESLCEFKTLLYKKKLNNHYVNLNFILDKTNEALTSSINFKKIKFDLIIILVDLSSERAKDHLEFYVQQATIHFPNVDKMLIGTKSDKQLKINVFNHIINTSEKTGEGFAEFDAHLMAVLNPQHNFCNIS